MTDTPEEKIIDIVLPERKRPGFMLTRPVTVIHPKTRARTTLPIGEIVPLLRVFPPTKEKYRRLPFLVFHEACGPFRLGHGHDPIRFNEETKEFEYVTEEEGS